MVRTLSDSCRVLVFKIFPLGSTGTPPGGSPPCIRHLSILPFGSQCLDRLYPCNLFVVSRVSPYHRKQGKRDLRSTPHNQ